MATMEDNIIKWWIRAVAALAGVFGGLLVYGQIYIHNVFGWF
jgi:hypothetical protein